MPVDAVELINSANHLLPNRKIASMAIPSGYEHNASSYANAHEATALEASNFNIDTIALSQRYHHFVETHGGNQQYAHSLHDAGAAYFALKTIEKHNNESEILHRTIGKALRGYADSPDSIQRNAPQYVHAIERLTTKHLAQIFHDDMTPNSAYAALKRTIGTNGIEHHLQERSAAQQSRARWAAASAVFGLMQHYFDHSTHTVLGPNASGTGALNTTVDLVTAGNAAYFAHTIYQEAQAPRFIQPVQPPVHNMPPLPS